MKLSRLWGPRATKGAAELSKKKIEPDIALPRECIYDSFEGKAGPCPRCGSELLQSRQTYEVATRHGRRLADAFIMCSDFGWFCPSCPVVVLNQREICEMLSISKSSWDVGSEYAVLGILNLDAIPKEKRNLPLGTEDNPTPLVAFSNLSNDSSAGRSAHSLTRITRKRPFSKKRRR